MRRLIVVGLILSALAHPSPGTTLVMRDGRLIEGKLGMISGMGENAFQMAAQGAVGNVRPIVIMDDDLRRTFVPKTLIAKVQEENAAEVHKIHIKQRVATAGSRVGKVGDIIGIGQFDEYGRRVFSMAGEKGRLDVIQGITQITPLWTKVEGVVGKQPFVWDMRIATSAIPRTALSRILSKNIDAKNLDQRLSLVRLFLQAERYSDAQRELESIVQDFPQEDQLKVEARALRQLSAKRTIDEINLRRKSGQHKLAYNLLDKFPSEDVAGETLGQVRELLTEYATNEKQAKELFEQLDTLFAALKDSVLQGRCKPILEEIKDELNIYTFDRMAAFLRLADDPQLVAEDKFSLAASGWLMGSDAASTNLTVTLSMYEVRNLVRQYLAEGLRNRRASLLRQLTSLEGTSVKQVAQIISHMKPPSETPAPKSGPPGLYTLSVPSIDKEPDVTYYVQLPPQYDPYRRYPTVLTLNGGGTTPRQQIDWWAGAAGDNGDRFGQAARFGYIVIAVDWAKEGQRQYEYSAREHAAVLTSLRDACRRFSIDTDRVFLSGHSMGGDAVWDLGLAHPDLWAGVIPIVGASDRYCARYFENADLVPFYIVSGELDGDKTKSNARDIDRYMIRRYDVTVVEFLGRGHENFSDEIQRIYDWMGRRQRDFFPKEFKVSTMRTWDNFFWWLELDNFPKGTVVEPSNWPPPRGTQPMRVTGTIKGNNIFVTTGADKISVWLAPEMVDFNKPIHIRLNGKSINSGDNLLIEPNLETLLDDVRTRGERQHPFWAKVE